MTPLNKPLLIFKKNKKKQKQKQNKIAEFFIIKYLFFFKMDLRIIFFTKNEYVVLGLNILLRQIYNKLERF